MEPLHGSHRGCASDAGAPVWELRLRPRGIERLGRLCSELAAYRKAAALLSSTEDYGEVGFAG